MVFYEEFIKKLETANFEIKGVERFHLEGLKLASIIVLSSALVGMGLYQAFIAYGNQNIIRGALAMILIFFGIRQFKVLLTYRISIDTDKKILKSNNILVNLDEVKICTLRETKVGKHMQTVVDMITNNNEQFIIPFYMGKKLKFAYTIKTLMGKKFSIQK